MLPDNNLSGSLPPELGDLAQLRRLSLYNNKLTGPIPPELGKLEQLTLLDLSENQLEGSIPAELGVLARLDTLDLYSNELTGTVPPTLGTLGSLLSLRLSWNRLSGSIPPELGDLGALEYLSFSRNELTGTIPTELGELSTLELLSVSRNGLTGEIPAELGDLAALEQLYLHENELTGEISALGALTRLETLWIHDNGLSGPIPEEFGNLTALQNLRAADNELNGVLPGTLANLRALTRLELEGNSLSGSLPPALGEMSALQRLWLDENHDLAGLLPRSMLQLERMVELSYGATRLCAHVDEEFQTWLRTVPHGYRTDCSSEEVDPFAEFSARSRATYTTSLDLTTDDGQWGLVLELEALRTSENGSGYYYGAAASVNGYVRGRARTPGWTSMGKASMPELAHEVGHNVSLNHAPCGDPPNPDRGYPYRDGSIGVWGYDFRDGSLVSPERRKDIMGYCYSLGWLSDFHYRRVIDHRVRLEGDAASPQLNAAGPPSNVLVLWGGIVGGEMRIEPVFSMRAPARLPQEPGRYRIRGIGSDGRSQFSLDFNPGEDKYGDRYFFFTIPIQPDWAETLERITLTGPEGLVYVDSDHDGRMTVVSEPGTGRIRAILRDWEGVLPEALGTDPRLDIVTTRGLRDAVRLRR